MDAAPRSSGPTRVDRYELYGEIASGGMATVHLGRLIGPAGFGKTVAIKRLHPHLAKEPEFVTMLTDEARVAGRIGHPNIVATLDIVAANGELFLIMEYVPGLTLSALLKRAAAQNERIPLPIASAIMTGVLHGLHAVHEARDESGSPLDVVHRDVSPQNILVGTDGIPRVLDFGIAKAAGRLHTTRDGQLKGKLGYMAPEQLSGGVVDRRTDIYAASVVLWEVLTGERLFEGEDAAAIFGSVMQKKIIAPSQITAEPSAELDLVALRGLEREPPRRFARARDMAIAIENAGPVARASEVGEWVAMIGEDWLNERAQTVSEIESHKRRAITEVLPRPFDKADGIVPTVVEARARTPRGKRITMTILAICTGFAAMAFATAVAGRGGWRSAATYAAAIVRGDDPPLDPPAEPRPLAIIPLDEMQPALAERQIAEVLDPPPVTERRHPSTSGAVSAKTESPRTTPKANKAPSCTPPFTIDSKGFKHYKLNCL